LFSLVRVSNLSFLQCSDIVGGEEKKEHLTHKKMTLIPKGSLSEKAEEGNQGEQENPHFSEKSRQNRSRYVASNR